MEVYQKSLEAERVRCIKAVKDGISVEVATSITRKLRKLYAVTQKNMDLLDRAIVESFVENYPTESTRIHMGRMAPTDPPSPPKRLVHEMDLCDPLQIYRPIGRSFHHTSGDRRSQM